MNHSFKIWRDKALVIIFPGGEGNADSGLNAKTDAQSHIASGSCATVVGAAPFVIEFLKLRHSQEISAQTRPCSRQRNNGVTPKRLLHSGLMNDQFLKRWEEIDML